MSIMKNILIVMSFMLLGIKAQAQIQEQSIVTIGKKYKFKKQSGDEFNYYFKDVNGVLDKYLGVWEGELEDYYYSFKITKKIKTPNPVISTILEDGLVIHFKITNKATGQEYYNKEELPKGFEISITKYDELSKNKYVVYYYGNTGEKIICGDKGFLHLELMKDDKMKLHVEPNRNPRVIEDGANPCPDGEVSPPIPAKGEKPLVLTKKKANT